MRELKERLSAVVHRTLRRQVREYVRYTNRRSIVEDFAPVAGRAGPLRKGQRVPAPLARPPPSSPARRLLLTLVYRKLLASLDLRDRADAAKARRQPRRNAAEAAQRGADADALLFEPEEAQALRRRGGRDGPTTRTPSSLRSLQDEVWELEQYAQLADGIRVNAKGEALKRALDRIFTVARAHQWPEKAVIFTEIQAHAGVPVGSF